MLCVFCSSGFASLRQSRGGWECGPDKRHRYRGIDGGKPTPKKKNHEKQIRIGYRTQTISFRSNFRFPSPEVATRDNRERRKMDCRKRASPHRLFGESESVEQTFSRPRHSARQAHFPFDVQIQNGFVCYGTDSKGNDIKGLIKKDTKALFVGNEHDGLSGKILRKMDEVLSIEMQNDFDSLNVACATSILIDRLNRIS